MRAVALASLLALVAGCASPPPATSPEGADERGDFSSARVGDRVDLRYDLDEVRGGVRRQVVARAFVEVVKRDGDVTWVRVGVRDADGAPLTHPTVTRDFVLAVDGPRTEWGTGGAPAHETIDLAGRPVDCVVWGNDADGAEGGVARTWEARLPALYLVTHLARRTFALHGAEGDFVRTRLEVTAFERGPAPSSPGALPPDAVVLFAQPDAWAVTRGDGRFDAHRVHSFHGALAYDVTPLAPAADGSIALDGATYAAPGPFDPEQATEQGTLVSLLEKRALAAARGEAETDPMVTWRERPVLAEGASARP